MGKVVARIKGGLGNQMFCYAAAKRLAIMSGCNLCLDTRSGFRWDYEYNRKYSLDVFNINEDQVGFREGLVWRLFRRSVRILSRILPYNVRPYIEQEGVDFDPRILYRRVRYHLVLDGFWQSENYFGDIKDIIRDVFRFKESVIQECREVARALEDSNSVAIHVRFFDEGSAGSEGYNLDKGYYLRAIDYIGGRVSDPIYYLFSNDVGRAKSMLADSGALIRTVGLTEGQRSEACDMYLMTRCRHLVIANSTFSWWAGWLADFERKIVVAPHVRLEGVADWGFQGLIPESWVSIEAIA